MLPGSDPSTEASFRGTLAKVETRTLTGTRDKLLSGSDPTTEASSRGTLAKVETRTLTGTRDKFYLVLTPLQRHPLGYICTGGDKDSYRYTKQVVVWF